MGGGVAPVRAGLQTGLLDDVHLATVPVLPGASLFAGLDPPALGYKSWTASPRSTRRTPC